MTEVGIRGVDLLQDRMQKTQESLKDVDENIKKLTGRSPADFRGGRRGRGGPMGRGGRGDGPPSRIGGERTSDGQARLFSIARRSLGGAGSRGMGMERERERVRQRRSVGGIRYSRDSDEEEDYRVGLASSVKQSIVEVPSREESLSMQKQDRKGLARNKRMFGLLLGTLQKFKADSSQGDQNKKRQEIEEKLEQKAREEKAEIHRQKQDLWDARRKKTRELRRLETKLELVENHQKWETETLKMKNFIRTEHKPHIFWLPKDHVPETLRKHASSKKALDKLIEERKQEMEKDIEAILDEAENEEKMHSTELVEEEEEKDDHDHDEPPIKRKKRKSEEGSDLDEAMEAADHAVVTEEIDVDPTQETSTNQNHERSNDLSDSENKDVPESTSLPENSDTMDQQETTESIVKPEHLPKETPDGEEPMNDDDQA